MLDFSLIMKPTIKRTILMLVVFLVCVAMIGCTTTNTNTTSPPEQGNAEAQYNLGDMYHNGTGVAKDDNLASSWYEKAAERK